MEIYQKQESSRLLFSLAIKNPLSEIPLVNTKYKMNEIVNKFLLAGDKCIPEMH